MKWSQSDIKDIFRYLQSRQEGLSSQEVKSRLVEYGENITHVAKEKSALAILLSQFTSPLILILMIATLASALLGEWIDAAIVGVAIALNGVLGFIEEYRADASLRALQSYLPVMARVKRDGSVMDIEAKQIVPGDILQLRAGDRVVADARLFRATYLSTDESPLTGESSLVRKEVTVLSEPLSIGDQTNMIFAGTVIAEGMGEAVVVHTGSKTEIGKISSLVSEVSVRQTPLQQQIAALARIIGFLIIGATIIVMTVGYFSGYALSELVTTGIAIAVSAVPEGLAIVTTAILAIGMQRLLKQSVLVRRLVATETLGSVSVICVDKTGTLTTGEMAVRSVLLPEDSLHNESIVRASLQMSMSYTSSSSSTNPTEKAIVSYLDTVDIPPAHRTSYKPFNSSDKYSEAEFSLDGARYRIRLGAPDVLMGSTADVDEAHAVWLNETLDAHTRAGRRLVSLMIGRLDGDSWVEPRVSAFVVIEDPLRPEAVSGVREARAAGLRPVMITGDHPETAFAIAKELELATDSSEVMTGVELDSIGDTQLLQRIEDIHVFARVRPDHKLRIVRLLQEEGAVIAMMGDGVNDAPALKAADIGVSVGSATEVAKEASDMVLLERAFSRITDAIFEGRVIFENIRKVAVFLMITSFSGLSVIAGAMFLGLPIPFSPIQLLWINLVTDGVPGFALGFEPGEPALLKEGPRKKTEKLLGAPWFLLLIFSGAFNATLILGLYWWLLQNGFSVYAAKTTSFMLLGSIALMFIFSARVLRKSIFRSAPHKSPVVLFATLVSIFLLLLPFAHPFLQDLFEVTPIQYVPWQFILPITVFSILILDFVKVRIMRYLQSRV